MRAIFLDIETTGLDFYRHSPIDIAFRIIDLTLGKQEQSYQTLIKPSIQAWKQRDLSSMKINGYTDEQLASGKEIASVGKEIIEVFTAAKIARGKAIFICQNPAFDRAFFSLIVDTYTQERLFWPYHWLDLASMYWTILMQKELAERRRYPEELNLSKNAIAGYFSLPPEQDPHSAINGVDHLIACYHAIFSEGSKL